MPIDMTRIKANVAKMASMGAPESDIDGYISSEGTNVEAVRAFNQPQYRGGANSSAMKQSRSELNVAQSNVDVQSLMSMPVGIPASIARALQTGQDPLKTVQENYKSGEIPSYSDVLKGAGASSMVSDIGGGAMDIALYPEGAKGIVDLGKLGLAGISKALSPFKEAISQSKSLASTAKEIGSASKAPASITRRLEELKDSSVAPLKESIDSEKSNFQDVKSSLEGDIANAKGLKAGKLEVAKDYQRTMKENIMADLNKQKESLEEALQGEAEGVAQYMKNEIPDRIRSMNDVFGKHIDEISDSMEKAGKGISQTDRFNILNATKEEADALGINTGRARNLLDRLHSDATNAVEGKKVPLGILGADGRPIVSEIPGQGSDMIPFKNFIQETREFRRIMSDAKLSGIKGMNDEDIVGAIYNKNVNKYLENNVSGYRSLQKDYAPVINAMKTARRIFKPGDIYSDEQGVNLLKRYAMGKTSEGKEQLFKDIQASSRFGAGTKDFTGNIKSIGDRLADVKTKISDMPKQLQDKFSKELDSIAEGHDKEISTLQEQLGKSKDASQMKMDSLKDKIQEVNAHYGGRIKQVQDTADKLKEFKKKAFWTGIVGSLGFGEIARKGKDAKELLLHL